MNDSESAAYFYHDITQLIGEQDVYFYPSSYKSSVKYDQQRQDAGNEILRTEVLNCLESQDSHFLIVSYPEALTELVVKTEVLKEKTFEVKVGESVDSSFMIQMLLEYGFSRVDFVYEPGQFSVRGSIIDIYSYSCEYPYRIDFFGDEVDSIRTFEVESQLSKEKKDKIAIVPNIHDKQVVSDSILSFLPEQTILSFLDFQFTAEMLANVCESVDEKDQFIDFESFIKQMYSFRLIDFGGHCCLKEASQILFHSSPQPAFNKNFDLIADEFKRRIAEHYTICLLSDNKHQIDRLDSIFKDKGLNIVFTPVLKTLHEGFVDEDTRLCCYTDHQIFDRYHKYSLRSDRARSGQASLTLKDLNSFKPGDYVVHIDHGVARFGGLIQVDVNGKKQEVIKLLYKNDDLLLVSIHSLHKISKYKSKEGSEPTINKLGTGAWQTLKERTKKKVKDIARDLIALYAKRREEKGYAFSPDTFLQSELEASFIYEDTPDQLKTTKEVKQDMERDLPMDRLVCGDVGFGKTEIAIRAAFKAVCDNKQVAILVPTTVLALQHYKTFSERLKDFPCKVDYLNRSRSAKDVKKIINELKEGTINILIGTQKVLGKEVKFKDLGLLIIDEEQKFGVSVKEKIKQMKVNIDTLTMTATPIPRTLQFSLMGARDLSVINTPPPNRHPIQTELHTFNEDVIRDAIRYELERNGQVFFINNRVQNLPDIAALIHRLVPEARVAIGHGQMKGEDLEKIVMDFLDYEYDVLLATTIVESGIDISNCNTIIINNAQNFGLSDLHQLRGRVGRSNRRAFCYLLAPPLTSVTPEARRRLQAIESFSDLGSGFNIAMQDLDIRGAGNLLGAEQSGFIADLGYETYQKILNEAVVELKVDEFSELYQEENADRNNELQFVADCQVETDLELTFPSDYVENISERMSLYRELDNVRDEKELQAFEMKLLDRFGTLPAQTVNLMLMVRLRWIALSLGFEKLTIKQNRMAGYFVQVENSPYFQSEAFGKILNYFQTHIERCKLRDVGGKRSILFSDVSDVRTAYDILKKVESSPSN
ncbi:MAG: transcription-repair coupling factor [Paludibacteraceae bacterium]|nr:transcription-repair coupling factor [Paludibacteraceae bacterium]